jgi:hypothetical protein
MLAKTYKHESIVMAAIDACTPIYHRRTMSSANGAQYRSRHRHFHQISHRVLAGPIRVIGPEAHTALAGVASASTASSARSADARSCRLETPAVACTACPSVTTMR